jgi:LacI family transcriptional regulator
MGAMAVQTVLVMAEGNKPSSRHVELATSLMVRDSTAPVPVGGHRPPGR